MLHRMSYLSLGNVQVDNPAQLANLLVSATDNSDEIESEDVSLTVGLLDTVSTSKEDLKQEDVSDDYCIYENGIAIIAIPFACINSYVNTL